MFKTSIWSSIRRPLEMPISQIAQCRLKNKTSQTSPSQIAGGEDSHRDESPRKRERESAEIMRHCLQQLNKTKWKMESPWQMNEVSIVDTSSCSKAFGSREVSMVSSTWRQMSNDSRRGQVRAVCSDRVCARCPGAAWATRGGTRPGRPLDIAKGRWQELNQL